MLNEILYYGGIAALTGVLIAGLVTAFMLFIKSRKLNDTLQKDYGAKRK